jgi:hypothetical protein
MSTVEQIEAAIRALPAVERDRLARDLPKLFPEMARFPETTDEEFKRRS